MAGVDLAEYPPVTRFGCDVEENWQCKFRHFCSVVWFSWRVFQALMCVLKLNYDLWGSHGEFRVRGPVVYVVRNSSF